MLTVATYNIHKGFSPLNQRVVLHDLRSQLHHLSADIVFLQEVQGEHAHHSQRHEHYPAAPQHEFLADSHWPHHAYGKNSVYAAGHHGNAILSRYPIHKQHNLDISAHRFESRGLLHVALDVPQHDTVHCFCTHFGLFANGRRQQAEWLIEYVRQHLPADAPLILAGDFNDWQNRLDTQLAQALGLEEVFQHQHGQPARSFPARLPLLRLDRIYVRGFRAQHCQVHPIRLSDHAALSARLQRI